LTERLLTDRIAYRTVIIDVDSTLSGIEGIEWLAALRGAETAERITDITERAMRGQLSFDGVYAARLDTVRPTRAEVAALGNAYIAHVVPGAERAVKALGSAGVRVVVVSGGIRDAVLPLVSFLGLAESNLHAVPVYFDEDGAYAGYDTGHPCARQMGKRVLVTSLSIERPALVIGDGITDAELKPIVDAFAVFTGVVRREEIVLLADFELQSFDDLVQRVIT
jgi:HAD superfamily phosphoserine phosphatase-like hydrolase